MKALHEAPSLSKSALLLSPCIAWAGPQAQWYKEEQVDTEDLSKRDLGIAFHKLADLMVKGDSVMASPEISKWVAHAANYLHEVLFPRCDSVQSEVAVAINWSTGAAEILPGVKDRGYPKTPGFQYGTADLVCILNDGSLLIADWKTGEADGATEQLLSLAVAFQKTMAIEGPGERGKRGPNEPDLYYRPVRILCLQVNDDGVWPHEQEVSQEQLDAHADAMAFQWEDIGKRNTPVPGIHCTKMYCPHLAYCPAITAVTLEASTGPQSAGEPQASIYHKGHLMILTDTPSSDAEAGYVMASVSAAKRQIKYLEAGLKEYVTKSGGKVTAGQYIWSDGNNGWRWRKQ